VRQDSTAALARALAHPRFEVVPLLGVEEQARYLPRGAKVTVTCSPTRGIDNTLRRAEQLAGQGLQVVPHISARLVVDTAHLKDIVQRLDALGLREIFVIGGDVQQPAGSFSSALDLLRALADMGHDLAQIGIAAYPERHPLVDEATLRRALAHKQPFASYMVTQICFDPEAIMRWLAGVRQQGIDLPVHIGVPGVLDSRQLLRISMKIGVGDSMRFLSKHTSLATRLLRPGRYAPDRLVARLAPYLDDPHYNIGGLHINTFNQMESTEEWRQQVLKRGDGRITPRAARHMLVDR
jgi:methylenetetrahydrofolate reductase (NADPH)